MKSIILSIYSCVRLKNGEMRFFNRQSINILRKTGAFLFSSCFLRMIHWNHQENILNRKHITPVSIHLSLWFWLIYCCPGPKIFPDQLTPRWCWFIRTHWNIRCPIPGRPIHSAARNETGGFTFPIHILITWSWVMQIDRNGYLKEDETLLNNLTYAASIGFHCVARVILILVGMKTMWPRGS